MAPPAGLPKHWPYRLDYNSDEYSAEDMQKFYESRTHIKTKLPLLRGHYVIRLQELDREATFRFQDLPTEMRLLVYNELLAAKKDANKKSVWTSILATSKGIQKEAMDVWSKTL